MRRVILLLALAGCAPSGERWARSHLGWKGARVIEKEALASLAQPAPPITTEPHCARPRVLMEVSDYVPYEVTFSLMNDDDSIKSASQVRCLVLYTHHGQEMAHHPETRLTVRVVDRVGGAAQRIEVRDHKGALEEILARL